MIRGKKNTIRVNKYMLTQLTKRVWNICPNCDNDANFELSQEGFCGLGWHDVLKCSKCGHTEDVTDYDTLKLFL